MGTKSKVNPRWAFAIAVVVGLIAGKLIKKFSLGLMIGITVSLLYVLIASAKKNK